MEYSVCMLWRQDGEHIARSLVTNKLKKHVIVQLVPLVYFSWIQLRSLQGAPSLSNTFPSCTVEWWELRKWVLQPSVTQQAITLAAFPPPCFHPRNQHGSNRYQRCLLGDALVTNPCHSPCCITEGVEREQAHWSHGLSPVSTNEGCKEWGWKGTAWRDVSLSKDNSVKRLIC